MDMKRDVSSSLLHNPSNFNTAQAKSYVGAVIFTENYTRPTSLRQAKGWRIRTKNRQYMWTARVAKVVTIHNNLLTQ